VIRVTSALRQHGAALRLLLVMTVLLGLVYPLAVTAASQVALGSRADGSFVRKGSAVVGSSLIGQLFVDEQGAALPRYFQSRPSAAGDGYDPTSSSASNLQDLVTSVRDRRTAAASLEDVDPAAVPADALTASGSGLDPDISPEYAMIQVQRVADARGLPAADVRRLVQAHRSGRDLGFIGEPTVNVLRLNLALDALARE